MLQSENDVGKGPTPAKFVQQQHEARKKKKKQQQQHQKSSLLRFLLLLLSRLTSSLTSTLHGVDTLFERFGRLITRKVPISSNFHRQSCTVVPFEVTCVAVMSQFVTEILQLYSIGDSFYQRELAKLLREDKFLILVVCLGILFLYILRLVVRLLQSAMSPSCVPSQQRVQDNMDELRTVRLQALMGDFYQDISQPPIWGPPSSRVLLFVSSTFTDTHEERNILQQRLLPELRERASEEGVDIIFCDLRSGIPDANTLDHMTWLGCQHELHRCFSLSAGYFFLSLQSSKYGYMPIPKFIDQEAYEKRLKDSVQMTFDCASHAELVALALEWYHLDTNAVPPVYVLKNLTGVTADDKVFWDKVLPWLRELFEGVVFDRTFPDGVIGRSVTEYETKAAIALCGGNSSNNNAADGLKKKGIRWIYRCFDPPISVAQVRCRLLISFL